MFSASSSRNLQRAIAAALSIALVLGLCLPEPAALAQGYQAYLPTVRTTHTAILSLSCPTTSEPHPPAGASPSIRRSTSADGLPSTAAQTTFVKVNGPDFVLNGEPYRFVGVNASYLAGPFFPEEEALPMIPALAARGVQVVRIWVEPWCDPDRLERLLDLGGQHNLRFIVTLQNFFAQLDGNWFRGRYESVDLPHIRNLVPRFAGRPEILMWELMNEPTCPSGDEGADCWDALVRWAEVTSSEIKSLDANHLVSVGTQRSDGRETSLLAFQRLHSLPSIDVISAHCSVGSLESDGLVGELAIARELGKPMYLGELFYVGQDESCIPLGEEVLQQRARAVEQDLVLSRELGIQGYVLWEYAYRGGVDMGSHLQYFCSVFGYYDDDPVWQVFRQVAR